MGNQNESNTAGFVMGLTIEVSSITLSIYLTVKIYGYAYMFFVIFTKGHNFHNFLIASLDEEFLPTCGIIGRNSPQGSERDSF